MNPPAPNRGPLDDEGPLPDLISGLMWLATAVAGVGVSSSPARRGRTSASHSCSRRFAAAWGVISIWLGVTARTMTSGRAPP